MWITFGTPEIDSLAILVPISKVGIYGWWGRQIVPLRHLLVPPQTEGLNGLLPPAYFIFDNGNFSAARADVVSSTAKFTRQQRSNTFIFGAFRILQPHRCSDLHVLEAPNIP